MQASTAPNEKALPRQVLRRSAAIQAHLDARRDTKTGPVDQAATPAPPSAQTTPPAEPIANAAPPVPADPRHADPEYWKQRFLVVEGRLRAREEEHRGAVNALHLQVSELTEQIQTLKANAPAAPTDLGEFLTPEQVSLLGVEEAQTIVDTVLKAARKQVAEVIAAEIKPLKEAHARTKADSQQEVLQRFLNQLAELIPNYAEIDESDGWKAWLAEEDEDTGEIRQGILDRHIGKASATGAAKLFKSYLKNQTKPPAPPVAPNGSGAGPSGIPPASPNQGLTVPTQAEIKDFYKRKATLRKGQPGYVTDQEALAFEKRLKLKASR